MKLIGVIRMGWLRHPEAAQANSPLRVRSSIHSRDSRARARGGRRFPGERGFQSRRAVAGLRRRRAGLRDGILVDVAASRRWKWEELRSGDRLDLAAKGIERVTVNASEKTALAPSGWPLSGCGGSRLHARFHQQGGDIGQCDSRVVLMNRAERFETAEEMCLGSCNHRRPTSVHRDE